MSTPEPEDEMNADDFYAHKNGGKTAASMNQDDMHLSNTFVVTIMEEYVKHKLTRIPGPPPKDGRRYVGYFYARKVPIIARWTKAGWRSDGDRRIQTAEPTAHLRFSLDDINRRSDELD